MHSWQGFAQYWSRACAQLARALTHVAGFGSLTEVWLLECSHILSGCCTVELRCIHPGYHACGVSLKCLDTWSPVASKKARQKVEIMTELKAEFYELPECCVYIHHIAKSHCGERGENEKQHLGVLVDPNHTLRTTGEK